jgi:hypothetical protein
MLRTDVGDEAILDAFEDRRKMAAASARGRSSCEISAEQMLGEFCNIRVDKFAFTFGNIAGNCEYSKTYHRSKIKGNTFL